MTLDEAVGRAFAGDAGDLYALLTRVSGLPGERANLVFARTFAQTCAADARGPALAESMARLTADEAPGGTALEFIPVCGVLGAGACATRYPRARDAMLRVLHDACDDFRFRVRDAVPEALAGLGAREGDALLVGTEDFTEGYFHAAALLEALVRPEWSSQLADAEPIASIVTRAFDLLDEAPRATSRYPGYKALLEAVETSIAPLTIRFGEPILRAVAGFAKSRDPHLREMVARSLGDKRLRARFPDALRDATSALAAAKKPPRDPRSLPRGTRGRGRKK